MTDEASDELYGLSLDEFTAARDALAARLRNAGNKDSAGRVKKLRKPSLAAWAVNQVARRDRGGMQELMDLRDRIEAATDARQMRDASEARRELITRLVRVAASVLEEAGHATSAGTMQAITQTFHAGDDEESRRDLLRGRLSRELKPSGFGDVAITPGAAASDDAAPDPRLEEKRERAEALARDADEADAEAGRLEREAAAAERALRSAVAAADAARRSAEEARRHAERARAEVDNQRG